MEIQVVVAMDQVATDILKYVYYMYFNYYACITD